LTEPVSSLTDAAIAKAIAAGEGDTLAVQPVKVTTDTGKPITGTVTVSREQAASFILTDWAKGEPVPIMSKRAAQENKQ
jgi:hypothetical protein